MRPRTIITACCLGVLLTGCAAGVRARQAAKGPSAPIAASFLGPAGTPQVTAVQFAGPEDGWFGMETVDAYTGQAMPGSTLLMRTTDGGATWTTAAEVPGPVLAVDFLSAAHGFVLVRSRGELNLLATGDGGATLTAVGEPAGYAGPAALRFTSPSRGFLVSGGDLDVTTDGGRTWQTTRMVLPPVASGGPGGPQAAPCFLDPQKGFLAENGAVYRTSDGGRSWQAVYRLPPGLRAWGGNLAGGPIAFATPDLAYAALNIPNCWAGGCPDVILRSGDGGATWQPVSYGMQGTLPDLAAPPSGPPGGVSALVAWGHDGVAATTMLGVSVSRDAGVAWSPATSQEITMPGTYSVLAAAPGGGAFAAGSAFLVRVPAGGGLRALWPPPLPTAQIDFLGPRDGFGLEIQPELQALRTSDGGRTWRPMAPPDLPNGAGVLTGLSFADGRHGWAIFQYGADREVYQTTDAGRHWRVLPVNLVLFGQLFAGGRGFMLTSRQGAPELLAASQSGRRFRVRRLPRAFREGGLLSFASPKVGFAAMGTALWQTANGGRSWRPVRLPQALTPPDRIAGLSADRRGDLWMTVILAGERTPEILDIRQQSGAWRQIRLPQAVSESSYSQSLDAVSPQDAWLLTLAGIFHTQDGGRVWRNVSWAKEARHHARSVTAARGSGGQRLGR